MKTNLSTIDMDDALSRVEKARANHASAKRRLTRAEKAVEAATVSVAETEEEMKAAANTLEQVIRKSVSQALKKGGPDVSIALAQIISSTLGGDSDEPKSDNSSSSDSKTFAETGAVAPPSSDDGQKDASAADEGTMTSGSTPVSPAAPSLPVGQDNGAAASLPRDEVRQASPDIDNLQSDQGAGLPSTQPMTASV